MNELIELIVLRLSLSLSHLAQASTWHQWPTCHLTVLHDILPTFLKLSLTWLPQVTHLPDCLSPCSSFLWLGNNDQYVTQLPASHLPHLAWAFFDLVLLTHMWPDCLCHILPTLLELSSTWYPQLICHSIVCITSCPPCSRFLWLGTLDWYISQLSMSHSSNLIHVLHKSVILFLIIPWNSV